MLRVSGLLQQGHQQQSCSSRHPGHASLHAHPPGTLQNHTHECVLVRARKGVRVVSACGTGIATYKACDAADRAKG
jgi:hypothetical protein